MANRLLRAPLDFALSSFLHIENHLLLFWLRHPIAGACTQQPWMQSGDSSAMHRLFLWLRDFGMMSADVEALNHSLIPRWLSSVRRRLGSRPHPLPS